MAPEHLFPAAFEDSLAAAKYFIKNAAQFKVDPNRIALGGK
jgi:acetyl esterase/lipase